MGFEHVQLPHDNAPAHKSDIVTDVLQKGKVTVLLHPPYSPDLVPSSFFRNWKPSSLDGDLNPDKCLDLPYTYTLLVHLN